MSEHCRPPEISKVCCLRDGWEYLLSHIDSPSSTPDQNHMTDHALELGLWLMRCQPFKDGNKRIGSFVINKILIQNGCGIFNVPVKLDGKFKQYLVDFYETNDPDFLKQWIFEHCMDGTHEIKRCALVQRCLNNSEKQCLIFVTGQGGGRRQCGGIVD